MCCVRRTYCYSSGLQGRDNGGWAAPGGSGWTIRWLGGQLCCQTSSAASPCEPRCWQPSDSAGWGNQGSSREVAVWLWNWCSPHFQCYLPGGICNIGSRRCSWAPGDWKLSLACQEPALCCHYSPPQNTVFYPLQRLCSVEELEWGTWSQFSSRMTSIWVYEIQDKRVKTCRMVFFLFHSPLPLLYFSSAMASHIHTCRWNVWTSVTVISKTLKMLLERN